MAEHHAQQSPNHSPHPVPSLSLEAGFRTTTTSETFKGSKCRISATHPQLIYCSIATGECSTHHCAKLARALAALN